MIALSFAHSGTGGGNVESIALALGLVLLGLAFLVQRSLDRRVSILLVVLGLVAFVGSFTFLKNVGGGTTITVQGQEFEEEELQDAVAAICTARNEAATDPEAAQMAFLDRAHLPLHVIAAAVEDEDRALSGDLLEAKQAVEEEFAGTADPEDLVDQLEELLEVTVEALQVLEIPASTC
ncbi:MAG: hypothetical protein KY391_06860 [Actinobacteria bacterium]|nr:hypothetical protein [Actinomycetota bacterium]